MPDRFELTEAQIEQLATRVAELLKVARAAGYDYAPPSEAAPPKIEPELVDRFEQEDTDFVAPCGACAHRFIPITSPNFICKTCIHYGA